MSKQKKILIADVEYGGGIKRFIGEFKKQLQENNPDDTICVKHFRKSIFYFLFFNLGYDRNFWIFPGIFIPIFIPKRSIIVVHDMIQIDYPAYKSWLVSLYFQFILKRNFKRCSYIVTVSHFSKERIMKYFDISERKILVLRNGVAESFINEKIVGFSERENQLLCITNGKEHKNDLAAVEIFFSSNLYQKFKLIFVGKPSKKTLNLIKEYNLVNRIEVRFSVNDKDLIHLYKTSKVLLFPSLYEGFGLPVIEAMSLGTPVIMCADNIGVRSYIQGAFIEMNPNNLMQVSGKLADFVTDEAEWRTLHKKSIEVARKLSWNNFACIDKITSVKK